MEFIYLFKTSLPWTGGTLYDEKARICFDSGAEAGGLLLKAFLTQFGASLSSSEQVFDTLHAVSTMRQKAGV